MSKENEETEKTQETEEIEGWESYLVKLALMIAVKIAMNRYVAPGSGAAVDFILAAYDYKNDNKGSCAVNIVSGVSEIATRGISRGVEKAVRGAAEKAVVGVKEVRSLVKKVRQQFGKELGKLLEKGTITASEKAAAIQEYRERAKTAIKEIETQAVRRMKKK